MVSASAVMSTAGCYGHQIRGLMRKALMIKGLQRTLRSMAPNPAKVMRDALALEADQRAVVANALLESLHETSDAGEIDEAWRSEASRRLNEVRTGDVELVDAEEHYARLRSSLTS